MNTMLSSLIDLEVRVRDYVASKVTPDMLYAFDLVECLDVSANQAGDLLKQNQDFWLFELDVSSVGRAGPGSNSPRRCYGALDLALLTKQPRDKVKHGRRMEAVANWFQDQTISGIRFRGYLPTPAIPLHGFTAYNGVINLEFEITLNT